MSKKILISIILILIGFIIYLMISPETTEINDYRSIHSVDTEYIDNSFRSITRFTYEGHDYLVFKYRGGTGQILHDPDCRKCKQN